MRPRLMGGGTRSVTLSDGYVVEGIPENVERVAALFGPSYEKVYVLGAEDKIAVCSSSHRNNWPWSHLVYQHVDDEDMVVIENASSGLNVEDLLEYDIDVCFYWSTADVLKALENIGIAAVPYSSAGGIDSTKEDLYAYAQVLGGDEAMAIAEKYAAYFDETLAEIEAVTLYPEYFPDVDMAAELQEFYQEFYRYDLTLEQAQAILNCENPS